MMDGWIFKGEDESLAPVSNRIDRIGERKKFKRENWHNT
jgi:hypothetical protein